MTSKAFDNATDANRQQGGRRNLIINGAMQVAQRGTNLSNSVGYSLDRYRSYQSFSDQEVTITQEKDAPDEFKYSLKATCAVADGSAVADDYFGLGTSLETDDIAHVLWGSATHCTVSFWVKASFTGTFAFNFSPDETDSGLNNDRLLYSTTYDINTADTWEYKTVTIPLSFLSDYAPLDTAGNLKGLELSWVLEMISGGGRDNNTLGWNSIEARNMTTYSSATDTGFNTLNATWQITGVQLEVGTVATPFEHRSYGEELALCQRYFQSTYEQGVAPGTATTVGGIFSSTSSQNNYAAIPIQFPVKMRSAPSVTTYDDVGNADRWHYSGNDKSTVVAPIGSSGGRVYINNTSAGGEGSRLGGQYTADAEL